MKLQGWILRKSKIPHLGNTWIHLEPDLLSKTSDRTRVNWHKPKREISSQHKKPHFYCKGDTPGITCPKGWRCHKPQSWALLGQVLTELQQPLLFPLCQHRDAPTRDYSPISQLSPAPPAPSSVFAQGCV